MNILGWILFGFLVGFVSRLIKPGREPLGFLGVTVIGILGALLGGWVGQALGYYQPNEGAGFIAATLGAVVILTIYYAVSPRARQNQITSKDDSNRPAA